MPGAPKTGWTAQKRRQHDQHFAAITRLVARTRIHNKRLRDDMLKVLNYSTAIADVLGVPKDEGTADPSGKRNLRESLDRLHQAIAKATSDDLSAAQIKVHHRNVDRLIPVFKQSAQHAGDQSRDLLEIHQHLLEIAKLYKG